MIGHHRFRIDWTMLKIYQQLKLYIIKYVMLILELENKFRCNYKNQVQKLRKYQKEGLKIQLSLMLL